MTLGSDLEAIREEYLRCASRQREIESTLGRLEEDEAELLEELTKVDRQLAYYTSLTREMKMSVEPPRLAHLLRSLRRP